MNTKEFNPEQQAVLLVDDILLCSDYIEIMTSVLEFTYSTQVKGYDQGKVEGFTEGEEEGKQNTLDDEELLEPKNIFYSLHVFKGCDTLEDFKRLYAELETRSFNFYRPLGLKDNKGKPILI